MTLAAGLAVMGDASAGTRLICAIICSTTAIVFTVLFLPPYSRARQPRSDKDPGFIAGMKAAFAHDGLRWITAAMAFDSSAVTLNVTYLVYFLTYNLKQHSEDTGSWMGTYIGVQIITQTIFTGVGQCILGREEPLIDPQKAAAFSPILKIVLWVGIISWVDSPGPLIASFVGFGIVSVPGIFFQSVAKSWVCDEDSHVTGIRRESILQGAMGAVVWLCNNGIPALFLIGLGIAGLDPTDCTGHDSGSAAQKACEDASREAQPDAVEDFLYWALIIPCSIFYVLASVCYSRFPINGQRLQTLQEKQAEVFKRIDQIVGERSNVEIEALEVEAQKLDNNAKDANILRQADERAEHPTPAPR